MSGAIRIWLGSAYRHLNNFSKECNGYKPYRMNHEENSSTCLWKARASLIEVEDLLRKTETKRNAILTKLNEWNEVINSLSGDEVAKSLEEQCRDDFEVKTAKESDQCLERAELAIEIMNLEVDRLTRLIATFKAAIDAEIPSARATPSSTAVPPTSTMDAGRTTPRVHLPTLTIPKFNGRLTEWQTFIQLFTATIHDTQIRDVEKFAYLRQYLGPEPSKLIEGIEPTETNYELALDRLHEVYGKPTNLKNQILDRLTDLAEPNEEPTSLRSFVNELNAITRQLDTINARLDDDYLLRLTERKLPIPIRKELFRQKQKTSVWNFHALMNELEYITQGEEEFQQTVPKKTVQPTQKPPTTARFDLNQGNSGQRPNNQRQPFHRTNVSTNNSNKTRLNSWACLYCNDLRHKSFQCLRFATNAERLDRLHEMERCYQCLRSDCKPPGSCNKTCYTCHKDHHAHVCPLREGAQLKIGQKAQPKGILKPTHRSNVTFETINEEEESDQPSEVVMTTKKDSSSLLTMFAQLFNPDTNKEMEVVVLIDPGSTTNYVTDRCRRLLQLPSQGPKTFTTETFGAGTHATRQAHRIQFGIRSLKGDIFYKGYSVPKIISEIEVNRLGHNEVITERREPDVLIGRDSIFQFRGLMTTTIGEHEMIETNYGPCITTQNENRNEPKTLLSRIVIPECEEDSNVTAERAVRLMCHVEKIGLESKITDEKLDDEIRRQFEENLQVDEEGRYVVQWLWNGKERELTTNFGLAFNRLVSMIRKLDRQPDLKLEYKRNFDDWEQMKVTEKVTSTRAEGIISYLPHQCVCTPQKTTTKIRVVIDASAKTKNGLSLNDCQHRGPLDLPQIVSLGIRARFDQFLVTSDVEKAFLMIGLHETQRDCVRFLLPIDWTQPITHQNIQVHRFRRLPFGVISSPSILGMVLDSHLRRHQNDRLIRQTYVDNVLETHNDEAEAIESSKRNKELLALGKMNLREFQSNSSKVMKELNPSETEEVTKILGIAWNKKSDELTIKIPDPQEVTTKREALSHCARTYDPLGLSSPANLETRKFVQDLWVQKLNWDEKLPNELTDRWNQLVEEHRGELTFKRFIGRSDRTYDLHSFCDASQHAYGAVTYLMDSEDRSAKAHLLFAKLRLAPKGNVDEEPRLTIPKLELQSAVVALKTLEFIQKELGDWKIRRSIIWSDAKSVLQQIEGTSEKVSVFVRNRVAVLRQARTKIEFRHIPGELNPADILSRGCKIEALRNNQTWWHGPDFLSDEDSWPNGLVLKKIEDSTQEEADELTLLTKEIETTNLFDMTRHSFNQTIRIVQLVIRFIRKLRPSIKLKDDANTATRLLIREAQARNPPSTKLEKKWRFRTDEHEIIRVRTRLANPELPSETKEPIWLPNDDITTQKLVLSRHERLCHAGPQTTTASLRRNYWVTNRVVKSSIRNCRHCQIHNVKPFTVEVGDLPTTRTQISKPFEATGADFLGPIHASDGNVYVLLLTCMTTRAIHLEVVPDQTTRRLLEALDAFYARRGTPRLFISDNGTSLVAAAQIFRDKFAIEGRKWIHITPRAPWMGGFYERMVQEVKRGLRRALGRSKVDLWTLRTLITKIEGIVNERPLLAVTEETNTVILRPVDFLRPHGLEMIDDVIDEDTITDPDFALPRDSKIELKRLHSFMEKKLNKFWATWQTHYLTSLFEKTKAKRLDHRQPKEGQVVIIGDDERPRSEWKLGVINRLIKGRDGIARTAEVMVIDERRKTTRLQPQPTTILKRAVEMLYELEAEDSVEVVNEEDRPMNSNPETGESVPVENTTQPSTLTEPQPEKTEKRRSGRKRQNPKHWSDYISH